MLLRIAIAGAALLLSGCSLLPQRLLEPTVHNPFPQLSRVAVAPFFNLSTEPTLDGRQVAIAYFNELQLVPGYEVVPVGTVETAILQHKLDLNGPEDVRRLAQLLDVDAVVIGVVTDYSPYYPPRMGMRVEWYATNPGFHPVPPGYGLPWGTHEEQDIPQPLVDEAEFALAKEQLKTQSPPVIAPAASAPAVPQQPIVGRMVAGKDSAATTDGTSGAGNADGATAPPAAAFWPDPRGFVPAPPADRPATCWPNSLPVMTHTRTYNGHDASFTAALAGFYDFRDDARFDGWQGYLQRSDDFIRFCCRMHLHEMLTARGGAGESRVVWKWPAVR